MLESQAAMRYTRVVHAQPGATHLQVRTQLSGSGMRPIAMRLLLYEECRYRIVRQAWSGETVSAPASVFSSFAWTKEGSLMVGLYKASSYSKILSCSSGKRRVRRYRVKTRMDKAEMSCYFNQSIGSSVELNCSKNSLNRGCHRLIRNFAGSVVE